MQCVAHTLLFCLSSRSLPAMRMRAPFAAAQVLLLYVVLLKWMLLGRVRPSVTLDAKRPQPRGAWYTYRMHLLRTILEHPSVRGAAFLWTGTAFFNAWLRGLGAKVGTEQHGRANCACASRRPPPDVLLSPPPRQMQHSHLSTHNTGRCFERHRWVLRPGLGRILLCTNTTCWSWVTVCRSAVASRCCPLRRWAPPPSMLLLALMSPTRPRCAYRVCMRVQTAVRRVHACPVSANVLLVLHAWAYVPPLIILDCMHTTTQLYPGVRVRPGACLGVFTYAPAGAVYARGSITQVRALRHCSAVTSGPCNPALVWQESSPVPVPSLGLPQPHASPAFGPRMVSGQDCTLLPAILIPCHPICLACCIFCHRCRARSRCAQVSQSRSLVQHLQPVRLNLGLLGAV